MSGTHSLLPAYLNWADSRPQNLPSPFSSKFASLVIKSCLQSPPVLFPINTVFLFLAWCSIYCQLIKGEEGSSVNIAALLGAATTECSVPEDGEGLQCLSVNHSSRTFQLSRQPLAPQTSSHLNVFNHPPEPFSTAVELSQEASITLFAKEIISGFVSCLLLRVWEQFTKTVQGTFPLGATGKESLENSFAKWTFWIPKEQTFGCIAGYFCYFR